MWLNKGCKRIKRLLIDYLENNTGEEDVKLVNGHLLRCPECKSYHDSLKEVMEGVRLLKDPELPEGFWNSYVSNFRKRLGEEAILPEKNILPEYRYPLWQLRLPKLATSIALLVLLIGIAFSIYLPRKHENIKYNRLEETGIEGYGLDILSEYNELIAHENGDIGPLLDELSEEEKEELRVNLLTELVS